MAHSGEPRATGPAPSEFKRPPQGGELTAVLRILLAGGSLSADETAVAFEAMMSGQIHHGEIGAFLALLAARTPSGPEILGAARVMRANVDRVLSRCAPETIVDTAGTGGAPKTFNVSTAAAIVAAGAGATVAKHGNRSRTGRGSAEVLRHLGVNVEAGREVQARCLEEARLCFCFAPLHHPATRHVMPVRLVLGFPTIFNLLGPLTNPAGARRQIMGVYEARFLRPIAEALAALGALRALVLHSEDGLDEISLAAPTRIVHVSDGRITEEHLDPAALGLERCNFEQVAARDLADAAAIVTAVLGGRERGPRRDMTLLNAAGTLIAAGLAPDWPTALRRAADAIDTGAAAATLERLVVLSNEP